MDAPRPAPSRRAAFGAFHPVATRWADNDVFGHVNNAAYYGFFDTAVTAWLLARGLIGLREGPMWMVAETGCRFLAETAFPDDLAVGLSVGRLGRSSVRWELALFRAGSEDAAVEGHLIHVHVDRTDRRPCPIPDAARLALAMLQR